MRILFSVYHEDYETEEKTSLYSRTVETTMSIDEIDTMLQLYDGFHSVLEVGQNLCFWDFCCFFSDINDLKNRIDTIPNNATQAENYITPNVLILEMFDPGNTDNAFYPDAKECFAYRLTRYECGASSFDAIVMFASNHPWWMVFVGGALWDITKFLGNKLRKVIKKSFGLVSEDGYPKRVVCLSIGNLYRNFSKITKIPKSDCQIVFLNRKKNNAYDVRIRTINNECFHIKCSSRGKITSIKPVDIKTCIGGV